MVDGIFVRGPSGDWAVHTDYGVLPGTRARVMDPVGKRHVVLLRSKICADLSGLLWEYRLIQRLRRQPPREEVEHDQG